MRYAAKVDRNQAEIVAALRAVGASVQSLATIGKGCPDLLVGYRMRWYVLELKSPGGKLTNDECEWIEAARAEVRIVFGPGEALDAIGAIPALTRKNAERT